MAYRLAIGLVFILNAITAPVQIQGQDLREDLHRSHDTWSKVPHCSFDVRFDLFAYNKAPRPTESMTGHIVRDGKRFMSNFNGILSLQNDEVLVTRDDAERYVMVQEPMTTMPDLFKGFGPDSLLRLSKHDTLLMENDKVRIYQLELKAGLQYRTARIQFDKSSGLVLRMEMVLAKSVDLDAKDGHPKDHPMMVFSIDKLDLQTVPDKSLFATTGTVRRTKDGWELAEALKDHELIQMFH